MVCPKFRKDQILDPYGIGKIRLTLTKIRKYGIILRLTRQGLWPGKRFFPNFSG